MSIKIVSRAGVLFSSAAALVADYPWGDFQGHTHWANVGWFPFFSPPVRLTDIALNVLLFLPLGFFAGLSKSNAALRAAAIALPISILGEWPQLYSHTRFPSATDVFCNVAGAIAGSLIAAYVTRKRAFPV